MAQHIKIYFQIEKLILTKNTKNSITVLVYFITPLPLELKTPKPVYKLFLKI